MVRAHSCHSNESMSVTSVNAVLTVESNGWTFKERTYEKDLQVFKDSSCIMQDYHAT